jgi:hypothetical protein
MTCTRAEFMSWLPGATRHAPVHIAEDVLTIRIGRGTVRIKLEESLPRRVGQMTLPILEVTMDFSGIDEATRSDFIAYFDLYTQRGGG